MNIPELGPLSGSRNVTRQERAENTAETTENVRTSSPETGETSESAPRDVFYTSEERRNIDDLTRAAERAEEEVRADRVEQARERAASGYYDSEEFLGRLALQITTTGTTGEG